MPLQGTAHQLAPVKSAQTSPAGGNLVCLQRALVPDTPESSQSAACCSSPPALSHPRCSQGPVQALGSFPRADNLLDLHISNLQTC